MRKVIYCILIAFFVVKLISVVRRRKDERYWIAELTGCILAVIRGTILLLVI